MGTGSDFLRVKEQEREAAHSAPSSIRTRIVEGCLHALMSLHGVIFHYLGARGSVVVEALRYKPVGDVILPAALGPGVYLVCSRNEYQKQENNVSGEWSAAGA
jgi:hypothetical protein